MADTVVHMSPRKGKACQFDKAPTARLIEIEIADGFAGIGRLFRPFHCLLKLFFQEVRGISLILNRLPEDGIAAVVLFLHGPGGFLDVVKSLRLDGGSVGDDRVVLGIYL